MPIRTTPLVNNKLYHIFNRGVARQPIFLNKRDYERFLQTVSYYRFHKPPFKLSRLLQLPITNREIILKELESRGKKIVELLSFVLMPNHFHFLLKQVGDDGLSTFVSRIANSYVRYFNTKHKRVGTLFQGTFKAVRIEDEEQLIQVSRYIHLNPLLSSIIRESEFLSYQWSSLGDFLRGKSFLVNIESVLQHFSSVKEYKKFILDKLDYARELKKVKHLLVEKKI